MASIRDVAKAAGVSVATASRVLSDSTHAVNSETRWRVQEAARSLRYSPNVIARALVSRRTQTVAFLVRDISDPYFSELARAAEDHGQQHGYLSFLCNTDQREAKELTYMKALRNYQVDGIILAGGIRTVSPRYQEVIDQIRADNTPIVVVGSRSLEVPSVRVDNQGSTREIVNWLISLGHRRIAYVLGPRRVSTSQERYAGFQEALKAHGIHLDRRLVVQGDFTVDGGVTAASALAALDDLPTAVVAGNDQSAIGCMRELSRRGLRIPADISVVGHGNQPGAADVSPPLTTVSVPIREMGKTAMEMVLRMIKGEEVGSVVVSTQLVIRESCRAL